MVIYIQGAGAIYGGGRALRQAPQRAAVPRCPSEGARGRGRAAQPPPGKGGRRKPSRPTPAAGTQTQETPNRTKGLILYKPCAARAPTPDSRARRAARLYSPCGKAAGELYKIKILYNQVEIFFKILQKYSGRSAKKHIRFKVLG